MMSEQSRRTVNILFGRLLGCMNLLMRTCNQGAVFTDSEVQVLTGFLDQLEAHLTELLHSDDQAEAEAESHP